ncbi:SGNH/GDSL hydrolase family protein [Dactylosporangium sp. NPDC049140]|uniref:SGNH/GDSL hydrolase family protein n=1 Tax=Dactylosporangium sp. NPDC049140 TaxID=3155647 RepID=UPI0033C2C853
MSLTWRGSATLAALTAAVITAAQLGTAAPAAAAPGPPPGSIASMGDSISRGFNACGWYVDCPSRSFSTGTDSAVNSHYLRIKAVNAAINGHNLNDAKSGAKVADMPGQAASAVSQGAAYVTILIGANDACTSSESSMTSVTAFRASLDSALGTLKSGLPNAKVLLISIPDIKRLWQVGSASSSARTVWSLFGVCQSMLANPASTSAADSARRDRVRQRVVDFNAQLAAACAAYGESCKYDGGAVFGYQFNLSQVSTWDYFHPNTSGQAVLASLSYAAGYGW